ncbi:Methyl-accepting chemotaxis protein (MCP) signaling protein, partial [human gut metagenome]
YLYFFNYRNKADLTTKLMSSIDEGMKVQNLTVNETLAIFDEITNADSKISDNIKSFNNLIDYIKDFSENLLVLIETLASSSEESATVISGFEFKIDILTTLLLSEDLHPIN